MKQGWVKRKRAVKAHFDQGGVGDCQSREEKRQGREKGKTGGNAVCQLACTANMVRLDDDGGREVGGV